MTSTITPAKQRVQKAASFLLALYSFLFFLMHFIRIFDNSFWGDEGFTIRLAKMGFVDMVSATAKDVHPPLYYFFTQILCHIFGFHGYTYHLTAVIPYGLILVLCCTVVRKWFGVLPAAVVVTLSSLTDAALIYNVEARMYSLAALFVFTAYLAFYQIYQKNRLMDWFIFGFASLCAAYTHYYALISVAFFYLMLLPLLRRGKEYTKRILLLYGLTVLSYIFWLYVLLKTFKRTNGSWWMTSIATFSECFDFVWGYKWLSVFAFVLFVAVTVLALKYLFQTHTLSNEALLFFAGFLSILGTIFIGLVVSHLFSPLIIPRYLFPLAHVSYLMLSLIIARFPYKELIASALICLLLVLGIPTYQTTYQHEKEVEQGTKICTEFFTSGEDSIIIPMIPAGTSNLMQSIFFLKFPISITTTPSTLSIIPTKTLGFSGPVHYRLNSKSKFSALAFPFRKFSPATPSMISLPENFSRILSTQLIICTSWRPSHDFYHRTLL